MNNQTELALPSYKHSWGRPQRAIEQMHELWMVLSKRNWTSLAVLPVDAEGSTRDLAHSLANAGTELSDLPVSAVTSHLLDPGSARALAALTQQVNLRHKRLLTMGEVIDVDPDSDSSMYQSEFLVPPGGQLILSVPSVAVEPVALIVANAADLVILGIELGKTRLRDVRRSIDLLGREKIGGCVLL